MADSTGARQRRGKPPAEKSDATDSATAAAGKAGDEDDAIEAKLSRLIAEREAANVPVGSPVPRCVAWLSSVWAI